MLRCWVPLSCSILIYLNVPIAKLELLAVVPVTKMEVSARTTEALQRTSSPYYPACTRLILWPHVITPLGCVTPTLAREHTNFLRVCPRQPPRSDPERAKLWLLLYIVYWGLFECSFLKYSADSAGPFFSPIYLISPFLTPAVLSLFMSCSETLRVPSYIQNRCGPWQPHSIYLWLYQLVGKLKWYLAWLKQYLACLRMQNISISRLVHFCISWIFVLWMPAPQNSIQEQTSSMSV